VKHKLVASRPADNPFASRKIDQLDFRLRGTNWDELLGCLTREGGRGAIVGPHGSGKTTLLGELAHRLVSEIVWIKLNTTTASPAKTAHTSLPENIDHHHTVLIDGAEQLNPWSWWRLQRRTKKAGTIVITSHNPDRLPTLFQCTTDPGLLVDLVQVLAPDAIDTVDLDELFQRHDGNIRLCFRELYDLWAGRAFRRTKCSGLRLAHTDRTGGSNS
jgi:hypothetical protein